MLGHNRNCLLNGRESSVTILYVHFCDKMAICKWLMECASEHVHLHGESWDGKELKNLRCWRHLNQDYVKWRDIKNDTENEAI